MGRWHLAKKATTPYVMSLDDDLCFNRDDALERMLLHPAFCTLMRFDEAATQDSRWQIMTIEYPDGKERIKVYPGRTPQDVSIKALKGLSDDA